MKPYSKSLIAGLCLLGLLPLAQAAPPTPAEQKLREAEAAIARRPDRPDAYSALAMALARRARETGDPAHYERALAAADRALTLAPGDPQARRARVWVRLGRHEFAAALEEAQALNREMPDDLLTYAYLTDAHVELGHYAEAEQAAQWLLDLRPGNIPGLTRAAWLRELFGDPEGAIELMNMAYQRTPATEVEDRAWILTHLGHLHLALGRTGAAEALLQEALQLFPGYHYALAQLARLRDAQGRPGDAADLLRRHVAAAPNAENWFHLGRALERAGRREEARGVFIRFEALARAEMERLDNANHELVFYYADHARRPQRALQVAQLEYGRRRDVFTLDAYAWALHRNGRHAEARRHIDEALKVGLRDPRFLYHAGAIALAQGDRTAARRHLRDALALVLPSDVAADARKTLARAEGVKQGRL